VLHFGLGEDTRSAADGRLASGRTQTFTDIPVDRRLTITEPPGRRPAGRTGTATGRTFTEVKTVSGSRGGISGARPE